MIRIFSASITRHICNIPIINGCVKWTQGIRKHEKHFTTCTKLFITFELKVFWHEERETQSFFAGSFYIVRSQPNQRVAPVAHKFVWARPALNLDSCSEAGTQLPDFFSNLKILSPRSSCVTSLTWPSQIPIWDFYFDISEWLILSARAWTPALMLHLTNPYAKQKVLCLTKPKGKIYKTKSLRNYITYILKIKIKNLKELYSNQIIS